MGHQIFVGLIAEGTTDYRFLEPIIEKTLVDVTFDCRGQVDIDVKIIKCDKGNSFIDFVFNASKEGYDNYGINMLIVHSDADSSTSESTYTSKINPAKEYLQSEGTDCHCKNIIALVPIFETESWMLADKELFLSAISTNKSESELGINGNPENFTNPKFKIEEAIRIGRLHLPKKYRNSLKISDLYSYLGQAIHIDKLKQLESFIDFENNIKKELIKINLLANT
ncbi:hypothetical protein [Empedobacter brevis]|uniref:hypothetical protein n=1 Tax=Empedobacter brevis TaxID=247 RepID=UPI00334003CE